MSNREPLQLHLNIIDGVTLRQLSSESELHTFSKALAYNHERFEDCRDLKLPTQKELTSAVEEPDSIEVGGDMYLGIWQQKQLLGGLMLRSIEGKVDLQFWLEKNASKNAIASTAISALTRLMVSRRRLNFNMIANVANDNNEAMRVLGRAGYIEKTDNIKDRTITFGVLSQMSENQIMRSEEVRNSPELVVRALSLLENDLDDKEDYEEGDLIVEDDEVDDHYEVDFETVSDLDEEITGTIYHDTKEKILMIDLYREVMDELGGVTRQHDDDDKYLLHTECMIDSTDGEIISFDNKMVVRDYNDAGVGFPENRVTNSPKKDKTNKDRLVSPGGLVHFNNRVALDQLSVMMRHNEEDLLDMLDFVKASIID